MSNRKKYEQLCDMLQEALDEACGLSPKTGPVEALELLVMQINKHYRDAANAETALNALVNAVESADMSIEGASAKELGEAMAQAHRFLDRANPKPIDKCWRCKQPLRHNPDGSLECPGKGECDYE